MWLPEPAPGTAVAGGFDGSENDDWTAIRLETGEGFQFTPRYGPDSRPTIWNPAEWDGRIPRGEVARAWAELADRFVLRRVYCDPGFHDETSWESEIESWAQRFGVEVFIPWPTNQTGRMYPAIKRFEADLKDGTLTHDGCPITATHMRNARKVGKGADRYALGKPSNHQKIDVAVTSVICHEAAADQRAAGWDPKPRLTRVVGRVSTY